MADGKRPGSLSNRDTDLGFDVSNHSIEDLSDVQLSYMLRFLDDNETRDAYVNEALARILERGISGSDDSTQ